jgi:hypothetical protein
MQQFRTIVAHVERHSQASSMAQEKVLNERIQKHRNETAVQVMNEKNSF